MLRKIKNNRSGVVLLVVIAIILVMSIILIGIFARNFSSALSSAEQAKQVRAESLARGAYWDYYNQRSASAVLPPEPGPVVLDGVTYTFQRIIEPGPPDKVTFKVRY